MIPSKANYYTGFKDGRYAVTDGQHKDSPWEEILEWYKYLLIKTFTVPEYVVNFTDDDGVDWYRTGYIAGVRFACRGRNDNKKI